MTSIINRFRNRRHRCPVCAKLPLDGPPLGIEAPPFQYKLDHDQAKFAQYEGPCCLYRLVRDLHRIWLENGEGDSKNYYFSCGPQIRYSVCTDLGLWGVLPACSEAVVHPNPLDPSTIARLQTWIERCNQEHEECRGEGIPFLPTRILDLGDQGSTGDVFLVETNGQRGRYIALSHCWGASNSFLTTRDTIETRKMGFLPDQAPATFRDAIVLARCLGVRYLWIDSLCIIQGDKEDWNIELSRMGDVYRNAYFMVAAANAADDAEGFLKLRPKVQCSMKVVAPTGQIAKIYLRPQGHAGHGNNHLPLDLRGWTLQEAYLSRRYIRFSDNRIVWGCQCIEWDEADRDRGHFRKQPHGGTWRSVTKLFPGASPFSHNPYQAWYNMIQEFSARQFSIQNDRLPALSGLATMVAAQRDGKYCAGLWWEDIGYSICWQTEDHSSIRPVSYIAPSWSWASLICPIIFPVSANFSPTNYMPPQMLSSVVFHDYQAILRGSNQYGEIEYAWLELEAPFAPLSKPTDKNKTQKMGHQDANRHEYFSIANTTSKQLLEVNFDFQEEEKGHNLFALFMLNAASRNSESVSMPKRSKSDVTELSGLVLQLALNEEKTCSKYNLPRGIALYQRVGFFSLRTPIALAKELLENAPVTKMALI